MKQDTIHINGLSIGYHSKSSTKLVAKGIHSTIYSGELTCLLGANGVGKSTLLRTLSAFQPKLDGEILVLGKDIDTYSDKELSTTIGVVLTDDKRIVEESIALVRIEELASRMVHTLSDGERQKVMIAKALAQETPVIYLDEPTAFLDFPSKVEIMQLLHHLTRKTNKTIFMSTHDLELALQISDKIWLMDKANGISTGTPEDLALSGHLSNFFARKGIVFDKDTGLFRIDNQFSRQIRLVGHGQKYAMVRKGLQRNGILANREVESNIWIETGDLKTTHFIIHETSGGTYITQTIEELLAYFDTEKS